MTLLVLLISLFTINVAAFEFNLCGVKYSWMKELGKGNFGTVDQARNMKTGEIVAVKKVHTSTKKEMLYFLREVKVMKTFTGDPRFVQIYCKHTSTPFSAIVMEFCNQGDLASKGKLPEATILNLYQDLGGALAMMRAKGVVHRDLKPENLLLHNGYLKVADFGLSRFLKNGETSTSIVGTPNFLAPEMLLGQAYTNQVDLWAAGLILYETLYGYHPYMYQRKRTFVLEFRDSIDIFLQNKDRFNLATPKLRKVLDKLLQKDPAHRQLRPVKEVRRAEFQPIRRSSI